MTCCLLKAMKNRNVFEKIFIYFYNVKEKASFRNIRPLVVELDAETG